MRRPGRNIAEADALAYVFGYNNINDVTARLQKERPPVGAQQKLRHVLPMGPCIVTADDSTAARTLYCDVCQRGSPPWPIPINSSLAVAALVSFLSQAFTLGTP